MFGQQVELAGALPHMLRQQHARLVGHQGCRLAAAQGVAGQPHHGHQEGVRVGDADDLVQPVADAECALAGRLHRGEDQALAADLQPGAVADVESCASARMAIASSFSTKACRRLRARFQSIRNTMREPMPSSAASTAASSAQSNCAVPTE
jgi:hypothetical protein